VSQAITLPVRTATNVYVDTWKRGTERLLPIWQRGGFGSPPATKGMKACVPPGKVQR